MKIKRNINGQEIEIELTDRELREAFYERDRNYYVEDIKSRYDCDNLDDSALADIAEQWKDALDNNDLYCEIYWEALTYIAKENGLDCPSKFCNKDIKYIYSEHDYGNTCNYVVFEIEN